MLEKSSFHCRHRAVGELPEQAILGTYPVILTQQPGEHCKSLPLGNPFFQFLTLSKM